MSPPPKVVLVTGCSSGGIGFHLCEQFAESGCRVYASSRKLESMQGFTHPEIQRLVMDVTKDDQVRDAVQQVLDKEGRIDIVVNNAGAIAVGPVAEMPLEDVKRAFDTNTFSVLRVVHAVLPSMAKRRGGLIVNIGSIVAEISTPWNGIYCASKAALHSITEVLQMECRPFNVNVMLVSAASVKSNLSVNHSSLFSLRPDSLYGAYIHNMIMRMNASQGPNAMATDQFAKNIVKQALAKNPPRYVTDGGGWYVFSILKWLPRGWVLGYAWKLFSRKAKA